MQQNMPQLNESLCCNAVFDDVSSIFKNGLMPCIEYLQYVSSKSNH